MTSKKKTVALAVGSAFVAGVALAPLANAAENPFSLKSLQSGYMVAADTPAKAAEAKCGQGKCGQGKCGGMMSGAPAPKAAEAKCGQGKCGAMPKN